MEICRQIPGACQRPAAARALAMGREKGLCVFPEQHVMNYVIVVLVCVRTHMGMSCALSSLAPQRMLQLCTRWLTRFPVS